jgi:hypothetical protein
MSAEAQGRYQQGFADGYRVGPDGIEPNGQRATTGYDTDLFGDPDYQRGLSQGRARRIDEQLAAGTRPTWPWIPDDTA